MSARWPLCAALAFSFFLARLSAAAPPEKGTKSPVLLAMEQELKRSMDGLKGKGEAPLYFISYLATERRVAHLAAQRGALQSDASAHSRLLDVEVRVGDYALDNTHRLRGDRRGQLDRPRAQSIAIEDDPMALRAAMWLETDRQYKEGLARLTQVRSNQAVKVDEEDASADFSRPEPVRYAGKLSTFKVDTASWQQRLKELSALFNDKADIHQSSVSLTVESTHEFLVNSEGATIQQGSEHARLVVYAETKAADGMDLHRMEAFDARNAAGLPDDRTIREAIERVARDLLALRAAPVVEPYTGPAILKGRAAGVFFHEIFGHRVEGQRQKGEEEGQTFTKKLGQPVLPEFLGVIDDPTEEKMGATDLNGTYLYDDEGVRAKSVTVVERGLLKGFLMSRSPVAGFSLSNGHGRKAPGHRAVGRQGNLFVKASKTVSEAELRRLLLDEVTKQGKPYGLLFDEISGGFTNTGRGNPQAFQVNPILVYRVYADGRPDELVRGVELIGTPLVALSKITAASNEPAVFNGYCGAESGSVPVSAIAPSLLTTQIEVQKQEKSADRPPILPPPQTLQGGRP